MQESSNLQAVSDDVLLGRLSDLIRQSRCAEADIVAHIAEVDARKLYSHDAASSMFAWCTDLLGLSEPEAYLRITVARASRRHPMLLDMLGDGRLHLRGIALLARYLTTENRQEILTRAAGLPHRRLQELAAELEPKPDAPGRIRKLPARGIPALMVDPGELCTCRVEAASPASAGGESPTPLQRPESGAAPIIALSPGAAATARARLGTMAPLAPSRHKVQFTASDELRGKLERLQALMRTTVPDGDLAAIIDLAVTEKLERLEAKRFARTKKPRKTLKETDTAPNSRHIPAAVRRAVHERDKGQCTYVDRLGRRCKARDRLEFHHHGQPFGLGGDHTPENVRLACRTHNALLAERDYGKEKMARYLRRRPPEGSVSEPATVYGGGNAGTATRGVSAP